MKYKYILLLLISATSIKATCQEKFIEVTVTDTAWVTPNQFIYTIMANPAPEDVLDDTDSGNGALGYVKRKMTISQRQKMIVDSLRDILNAKGFHILPQNIENSFSANDENSSFSIQVFTTTVDSIAVIFELVKDKPSLYGTLTWVKATGEEIYRKKLLQKLINTSKDKATTIAAASNLKIANIISVQETPKEEGGWTAYPPLSAFARSAVPGWHTTIYPNHNYSGLKAGINNQYQIESSFVVRFAVQ